MGGAPNVKTGIKVSPEEAGNLDATRIFRLLPPAPTPPEVEAQAFCTLIYCPYCGGAGRCGVEPPSGSYFRCIHCGALFRT